MSSKTTYKRLYSEARKTYRANHYITPRDVIELSGMIANRRRGEAHGVTRDKFSCGLGTFRVWRKMYPSRDFSEVLYMHKALVQMQAGTREDSPESWLCEFITHWRPYQGSRKRPKDGCYWIAGEWHRRERIMNGKLEQ